MRCHPVFTLGYLCVRNKATTVGQPSFKDWPDVGNQICHRRNMLLWLSKRGFLFRIVQWSWAFLKLLYISLHCNSIPGYGNGIHFYTWYGSINIVPYAKLSSKWTKLGSPKGLLIYSQMRPVNKLNVAKIQTIREMRINKCTAFFENYSLSDI